MNRFTLIAVVLLALLDPASPPAGCVPRTRELSESTLDEQIRQGNFAGPPGRLDWLKVLDWNIERGLKFDGIARAIEREHPNLCVFQEADLGARRTRRRNIAELLARRFRFNYVFAVEFEELSQGSRSSPAYHGQAILTSFPILSRRVLRFRNQTTYWKPRWYLPNWPVFQRRLGGRMALVAELGVGQATVVVYNLHLESRASERLRLLQLEEVLADARRYPRKTAVVLAGDFNTRSRSSRLIVRLEEAGFHDAISRDPVPTKPQGGAKDWIFVRGQLRCQEGKVHRDILASDHYPLSVRLCLPGADLGCAR